MARKIHKWLLDWSSPQVPFWVSLPQNGRIVKVSIQNQEPVLWMEYEEKDILVERAFMFIGTGRLIPDGYEYIETIFEGQQYVWHLYMKSSSFSMKGR